MVSVLFTDVLGQTPLEYLLQITFHVLLLEIDSFEDYIIMFWKKWKWIKTWRMPAWFMVPPVHPGCLQILVFQQPEISKDSTYPFCLSYSLNQCHPSKWMWIETCIAFHLSAYCVWASAKNRREKMRETNAHGACF